MNPNIWRTVMFAVALLLVLSAGWWGRQRMPTLDERPDVPAQTLVVAADCDVRTLCRAMSDDLDLELQLGPRIKALEPFTVHLRKTRGTLSEQAEIELRFVMQGMDMGEHHYRLTPVPDALVDGQNSYWRSMATLPVCSSGRRDWLLILDIRDMDRQWRAELPFSVE